MYDFSINNSIQGSSNNVRVSRHPNIHIVESDMT